MTHINNPIKALEHVIDQINHDTYTLTRDDIDSIECRLLDVLKFIKDVYRKRGKELS